MSREGYITVNGKKIDVFDIHMDWIPVAPTHDECEHCINEALRGARERVDIAFEVVLGGFVPTGPVVDGSVETAKQPDDKTTR